MPLRLSSVTLPWNPIALRPADDVHLPVAPTLSGALRLSVPRGGTVCRLRAWRTSDRWIVELGEHEANRASPVMTAFGALAEQARLMLRLQREPLWVEHWPQAALAALLDGYSLPARHLRTHLAGNWTRAPLPWPAFSSLLRAADRGGPHGLDQCRFGLDDGSPQPL